MPEPLETAPTDDAGKADFSDCYTAPDPRPYFRTLVPLAYQIPQQALPVFEQVLAALGPGREELTVLDVCCSYGLNAALLRCAVDLQTMSERYTDPGLAALSTEELLRADRTFYGERRRPGRRVLGLDVSEAAVRYAVDADMMDGGFVEDLEAHDPSTALREAIRGVGGVDVVTCTGGIGYVGPATFARLLSAMEQPERAWVVMFVLRMYAVDDVARSLEGFGLVTEQVPGCTVRQRRFASRAEQETAVRQVTERGLDPAGWEAEGWYYADCFLARPRADAGVPVGELLSPVED